MNEQQLRQMAAVANLHAATAAAMRATIAKDVLCTLIALPLVEVVPKPPGDDKLVEELADVAVRITDELIRRLAVPPAQSAGQSRG